MIPYKTYDTLLSIGPFDIKVWGFMVALGFLAALLVILKEAKRKKLDAESIYSLALSALIGGIIGGRLGWIITEARGLSFIDYFKIWQGGMAWYGALIGGLLFVYAYAKCKKLNLWRYLDVFALGLPIGMAIGRIGCYLIGDHIGKATNLPWGIPLNGITHPIPLYEIAALIPLFLIIFSLRKKKLFEGALFGIFALGYSFARFFIDFFRTDPTYYGLTIMQYISMALFVTFLYVLYKIKRGVK